MSKHKRPFDPNIVAAIAKLKWPLMSISGAKVFMREKARYESGIEHAAGLKHHLKIRDIEMIPEILRKPYRVIVEKKGRKGKCYYGKRKGVNKYRFIKIAVQVRKDGAEAITTICPSMDCIERWK